MEHKIIFTGPVGAGKTTAIGSISDIPVAATEARATDETAFRKENTTVAMDYGLLRLEGDAKVHLYGTPGQERFSFMWDILTIGGIGLVLMLDNARRDPLADLEFFVDAFRPFIERNGLVIGVTRMDVRARPGLYTYHTKLEKLGLNVPVFEVDARKRADIKVLLTALLSCLDPGVAH
jgi:signal recognition particle receptor subunit beta